MRLLEYRNTNKQRSAYEINQPGHKNDRNDRELRVVHLAEYNSNGLLPVAEEAGVVLLQQERSDNSNEPCDQEAEFSQAHDLAPIPTNQREEEEVLTRPSKMNAHQHGWEILLLTENKNSRSRTTK